MSSSRFAPIAILWILAGIPTSSRPGHDPTLSTEPGDIYLQLYAHGPTAGNGLGVSPGHAFMCISLHLNSGIKEDCYGFYPKEGVAGVIWGPGMVVKEFSDPATKKEFPARLASASQVLNRKISESQRRGLLKAAQDWTNAKYHLTKKSCIDFVVAGAVAVGLTIPTRLEAETPDSYLKRLGAANK